MCLLFLSRNIEGATARCLADYGITEDVVLDGYWSFKDQTHNPQLALQLPPEHERHRWSYARQGSHQPLVVGGREREGLFT
jgi:hypothetical protein|eukprot:SAG25_NODE_459_length_7828_cov_24.263907_9_plen_81_part_00